jgi:hypothetical protein
MIGSFVFDNSIIMHGVSNEYEQTGRIMKDLLALARVNNLSRNDASYLYLSMMKDLQLPL